MTVDPTRNAAAVGTGALTGLLLLPILSTIGIGAISPILPQLSEYYSATPGIETLMRSLVTSSGAATMVGAAASGLLAARFGERAILLGALSCFALFGSVGAFIGNPYTLLMSRLVVGLTIGAIGVMAISLLSSGIGESVRNRRLGYYSVASTAGAVPFMVLAGVLATVDWRLIFAIHLLAIPMMILVLLFIREPAKSSSTDSQSAEDSRFPVGMLLLGLCCGMVINTVPAYLPFYFGEFGEHRPDRIAAAITAQVATASIAALAFGWVRRRFDAAEVFTLAFLMIGCGLSTIAWGRSVPAALIGMAIGGFGVGLLGPNLFSVAANASPTQRPRRVGLARGGFFGAPLLAQLPLEPVKTAHGTSGVLFALAAFAFCMIVVIMAQRRTLSRAAI